MLVYAAVLIACLLLLMAARLGSTNQRKQVTLLCVFALTCFSALRGYVGTDTYAYHSMFSDFSNESLGEVLGVVEPAFALLIKTIALFSDNPFVFVISISIIQGFLLAHVAVTSKNPLDFLAIYITIFYLNFHFNIVPVLQSFSLFWP
jgi:EpsG family